MIPRADIIEWRTAGHPWQTDAMVEQDLIISRVLAELFSDAEISGQLVFRGGTALHKLFFDGPKRYSEDIDLVQRQGGSARVRSERVVGDQTSCALSEAQGTRSV